ncbi:glucose-6-phosphate dehydrogenase [Buchnera aphidicola (Kurisakia onigurumii)]|uniref:glucose-6-phosphate dehydrogenase n=1 Tax=Buchnera aphidicola TaxID=9 RepID=UPI0031B6EE34
MNKSKNIDCDIIIFGTKGDLAQRKLFPAIYKLEKYCKLHTNTRIIGVGRATWNINEYLNIIKTSLEKFSKEKINNTVWIKLRKRINFCNLDVNYIEHFVYLKKMLTSKNKLLINYLAMPPNTFSIICKGLASIQLNLKNSRIILEKPIGSSLKTSLDINKQVSKYFLESQIFRIDHYLGKESILNLLSFRFANPIFMNIWNNQFIDHIQITVSEKIGIEGRWNYFNNSGQIRDMIQNHLLQILTLISMKKPINLKSESIRCEKVKILQSLRMITNKDVMDNVVLGQYSSGIIDGIKVPSYLTEGNDKNSLTETYAAIKVHIDNKNWKGVPFYLRTGKRLHKKFSEIVIFFKPIKKNIFTRYDNFKKNNKIIIRLEPNEGIKIDFLNKNPGLETEYILKNTNMNFYYKKSFKNFNLIEAYERLILESIRGEQTLFVHKNEVEASWKWIDVLIKSCKSEYNIPKIYKSGTYGPIESIQLINKDNREWY